MNRDKATESVGGVAIMNDPEFWHGLTMYGSFGALQVRLFSPGTSVALHVKDEAERSTEDGEPMILTADDARKIRDLLNIATARGAL